MALNLTLVISIIGNASSFFVFAAPMRTFWRIYKKKSTECFSSLPYISALLNALFGLYYGLLKPGGMTLVTLNCMGCIFELIYIAIFLRFSPKTSKVKTAEYLAIVVLVFGAAALLTFFFLHGHKRFIIVGSLCAAVAVLMYAAPLSVMRHVIRTKNADFLPVSLSIFLLINAVIWSAYSFFSKDIFVGIPSVVGDILAVMQLTLYFIYKNGKPEEKEPFRKAMNTPEDKNHSIEMPTDHSFKTNLDERQNEGIPRQTSLGNQRARHRTASGKVSEFLDEELAEDQAKGDHNRGIQRQGSGNVTDSIHEKGWKGSIPRQGSVTKPSYRTSSGRVVDFLDDPNFRLLQVTPVSS